MMRSATLTRNSSLPAASIAARAVITASIIPSTMTGGLPWGILNIKTKTISPKPATVPIPIPPNTGSDYNNRQKNNKFNPEHNLLVSSIYEKP